MLATTTQTRRPYGLADYRYILQHYSSGRETAPQVAAQLGRPLGSVKFFISSNPELKKRKP